MQQTQTPSDLGDQVQGIADFVLAGGTLAQLYRLEPQELEAAYALGYSLYNQARWNEAFQVFSFLTYYNPLERRFHLGRAACLQMLEQHENALHAYGPAYVLDALDSTTALHIAECLIALRRKDEARAALEAVAELAADDPTAAAVRARAAALTALIHQ